MEPIPPPLPELLGFNSTLLGFGKLDNAVSLMAKDSTIIFFSFLSLSVTTTCVTVTVYTDLQHQMILRLYFYWVPPPVWNQTFSGPTELSLRSPSVSVLGTNHPSLCNTCRLWQAEWGFSTTGRLEQVYGSRAQSRFCRGPRGSLSAPQSAYFLANILHWGYRQSCLSLNCLSLNFGSKACYPISRRRKNV